MHPWEDKDVCRQYVINKKDISKSMVFLRTSKKEEKNRY